MSVRVRFLGSGDAFGGGGRFQTCILLEGGGGRYLIDCGATSLTARRRLGIEPNSIDAILLTHLHGDHFGGVPFFVLEARLTSRRQVPLIVAGPPDTRVRPGTLSQVLFPGMGDIELGYTLDVVELAPEAPRRWSRRRAAPTCLSPSATSSTRRCPTT